MIVSIAKSHCGSYFYSEIIIMAFSLGVFNMCEYWNLKIKPNCLELNLEKFTLKNIYIYSIFVLSVKKSSK